MARCCTSSCMRRASYRVFSDIPSWAEVYGNNEEFYANTIEMIYRSEKRLPIYDYANRPLDAASFLERNTASMLLTNLRVAQQSLFDALAQVNAGFNPIRQFDDRRRKLIKEITRELE